MSRVVDGKFIQVSEYNIFFSHVTEMILHHYDIEEHEGATFILGDYIFHPLQSLRELHPGRKLIVYQLEQLCGGPNWHSVEKTVKSLVGYDEIWEYDALNVAYLAWYGVTVSRLSPVRYVPGLRRILKAEIDIDVLFYGFMNERRHRFLMKLQKHFYGRLRFVHAYGVFGAQLDELIARSKVILNLHAFEPYHRQEQVRIFYPLINGKCVLSEKSQVNYFGDSILECTEEDFCVKLEEARDRWKEIGEAGAERFERETATESAYDFCVSNYAKLATVGKAAT